MGTAISLDICITSVVGLGYSLSDILDNLQFSLLSTGGALSHIITGSHNIESLVTTLVPFSQKLG